MKWPKGKVDFGPNGFGPPIIMGTEPELKIHRTCFGIRAIESVELPNKPVANAVDDGNSAFFFNYFFHK